MENGLNRLLTLDPSYQSALSPLDGKVISIEVTGILSQRFFCFSNSDITLLENMGEAADCALTVTPSALVQLRDSHQFSELIKTEQLTINGDIKLAQQFSALLTELNIDIEELLSHKLGDPLAHTLVYASGQLSNFIKTKSKQLAADFSEVATHEWPLAANKQALNIWSQQVAELENDINVLELRIEQLTEGES